MMYSCRRATELMSTSMDRNLSFLERLGLRMHLFLCKYCSRCWDQMSFLKDAMHHCAERSEDIDFMPDHSLSEDACERIKNALKQHVSH